MPTRDQILKLHFGGVDYPAIAERLGITAGQAYLIATGVPADGGDTLAPEDLRRPGLLRGSTQHLVNPAPENPTKKQSVLDWIKERARHDTQMRQAAATRDAQPGEINDPDDVREVTTVLTRDHNQVKALLEQLSALPGHRKGGSATQMSRRKSIVDVITVALSKHESVEQEYLWPAVRDALKDGDQLAEAALGQEQEGKDTLTALGRLDPNTDEFDELVEQLVLQARKHVAFEDVVFLKLRETMPADDREQLGSKLRTAERVAPTRPHSHAPKQPAAAVKAAGAAAAALDKVRDAAGNRPAKRQGKGADEADNSDRPDETNEPGGSEETE